MERAGTADFARRCLDLLAPCFCSLCGMPSGRHIDLCWSCEGELPWIIQACSQCAIPLPRSAPLCAGCLKRPPAFDRAVAACSYTVPISGWVHAAKYRGDFADLNILGHLLLRAVRAALEDDPAPNLLCPMPLHWFRRWRRGFNQAGELASVLSRDSGIPSVSVASRIRATPPQRGLDARERRRNLSGAFRMTRDIEGASVAIVDDVLTTGASADALARVLKAAGASRVSVWCCARTPESG